MNHQTIATQLTVESFETSLNLQKKNNRYQSLRKLVCLSMTADEVGNIFG